MTAVGGTALEVGEHDEWKHERAIDNGGGCDNSIARPSWQTGSGVSGAKVYPSSSCTGRVNPDVSALSCGSDEEAFPIGTCFLECVEFPEIPNIGSASAGPVSRPRHGRRGRRCGMPRTRARGGQLLSSLLYALGNDPTSYEHDFHDITEGSNGFPAAKGWDEATGWGTPIFSGGSPLVSEEERTIVSPPSKTTEAAGISASLAQTYEEAYEVRAVY